MAGSLISFHEPPRVVLELMCVREQATLNRVFPSPPFPMSETSKASISRILERRPGHNHIA